MKKLNPLDYLEQCDKEREKHAPAHVSFSVDESAQKRRQKIGDAQLRTAAKLEKLQEQFERSQIEQAKENRVNRWFTIASLMVAVVSLAVAILK